MCDVMNEADFTPAEEHGCSIWCEICTHSCIVCDVIVPAGNTHCGEHYFA